MKPLKICVYTICKNEEKFIDRWASCTAEADYIVVLDTGSTDHSLEMLRQHENIHTFQKSIEPWRFDTARNEALSHVPRDIAICLSLDMDEVLTPGWHDQLLKCWTSDATAASCRSVWSFKADGSEDGIFYPIRIHDRHGYVWEHAIHEVLIYKGTSPEKIIAAQGLEIHHHPDPAKKRDYLPMLEKAVHDHPLDTRDLFYLGREYLYHGAYEKCIETLKRYLVLSLWVEERCSALCFISKAYVNLGDTDHAIEYLEQAKKEAPMVREPLIDLAYIYYYKADWKQTAWYIDEALKITFSPPGFISQGYAWDATPYDLGCVAHYHLGHLDTALAYAARCLSFAPQEKRFIGNLSNLQRQVILDICHSSCTKRDILS